MNLIESIFHVKAKGSNIQTECIAGVSSFIAMCYMIFVVPGMLADAGMPIEGTAKATIWIAALSTLLMGVFANFPAGIAPGLGITAFFAYYICGPAAYTWEEALGAVFISGTFFLLLSITKIRQYIINAVPIDLKFAIVVGIGAFIAFIGMKNCGIIVADPATFVTLGNFTKPEPLLAVCGVLLIGALIACNVKCAVIIGIIAISTASMAMGLSPLPQGSLISSNIGWPSDLFMKMDLEGALGHGIFSIIFTLTMVDLFDTMGVLIALASKAGFMDANGRIENLDRALITDSLSTMGGAIIGTPTATTYLESAAGVGAGGKTGLTAVVISILFFLALFFTPLVGLAPAFATGPALIVIGAMMMQEVTRIKFNDFSVALPTFLTIITMPLTFNIATGFGFGFISWVAIQAMTGRWREINPFMLIIAICFAVNFALR